VSDPAAGVADDFQFKAGPARHALQVKWSQYPGSFGWGALVDPTSDEPAFLTKLAMAWTRLRESWSGPLVIHLVTNDHATSTGPRAGTPLAAATADGPRHFAAFLARAFEPVRQLAYLAVAGGADSWSRGVLQQLCAVGSRHASCARSFRRLCEADPGAAQAEVERLLGGAPASGAATAQRAPR